MSGEHATHTYSHPHPGGPHTAADAHTQGRGGVEEG